MGKGSKRFITVIIILLLLGVLAYFVSEPVFKPLSQRALGYLTSQTSQEGFVLEKPAFSAVHLTNVNTVTWWDFTALLKVTQKSKFTGEREYYFSTPSLSLSLVNLFNGTWQIRAENIEMTSGEASDPLRQLKGQDDIKNGEVNIQFQLNPFKVASVKQDLKTLMSECAQFMRDGRTNINLLFRATIYFNLRNQPVDADIWTEDHDGETVLIMAPENLKKLSNILTESLTEGEIQIYSSHPLLAPKLLKIRDYAVRMARKARQDNNLVSEDAYRHVLWSYLLTKEFDETFSKEVTDAHEIGATTAASAENHTMDFNNNSVGRQYAKQGYTEESLLDRALNDPNVIRAAA